jgi:hypothetical protein
MTQTLAWLQFAPEVFMEFGRKPNVFVEIIMINKVSGDFRRKALTTTEDVYDSHGGCQAGK